MEEDPASVFRLQHCLQGSSPLRPVLWVTRVSLEMLRDLSTSNEKVLTTTSIVQRLLGARHCGKCSTGTASFNSTKTPRNVHSYVPHLPDENGGLQMGNNMKEQDGTELGFNPR